jgi:hypothetical protein
MRTGRFWLEVFQPRSAPPIAKTFCQRFDGCRNDIPMRS